MGQRWPETRLNSFAAPGWYSCMRVAMSYWRGRPSNARANLSASGAGQWFGSPYARSYFLRPGKDSSCRLQ